MRGTCTRLEWKKGKIGGEGRGGRGANYGVERERRSNSGARSLLAEQIGMKNSGGGSRKGGGLNTPVHGASSRRKNAFQLSARASARARRGNFGLDHAGKFGLVTHPKSQPRCRN